MTDQPLCFCSGNAKLPAMWPDGPFHEVAGLISAASAGNPRSINRPIASGYLSSTIFLLVTCEPACRR